MAEAETWCVYRREWVPVFSSRILAGREECTQVFRSRYAGKIGDEDWRLRTTGKRDPVTWHLDILLPCQKGEFRDKKLAEGLALELGEGAVVVPWGSEEELELLDYGTRQLNTA